ncbi:MAG TPA: hypothetical protein VGR51_05660 [Thermoplasmata archaeon]|jgi:hypothetical protein|nr:hypothetical protein [Thermoplasmata archaeon]
MVAIVVTAQTAAAKAPTKAYVLTTDQTRSTVILDDVILRDFGNTFWDPWSSPIEQVPVGTPMPYRYIVVAIFPGAAEDAYVYLYMPAKDGRPAYYFEAGSDLGAWVISPAGIDELVLPHAPPSTGDAIFIAGDPRPAVQLPASGDSTSVAPSFPWGVGAIAALSGLLLWVAWRRHRTADAPDTILGARDSGRLE